VQEHEQEEQDVGVVLSKKLLRGYDEANLSGHSKETGGGRDLSSLTNNGEVTDIFDLPLFEEEDAASGAVNEQPAPDVGKKEEGATSAMVVS
jgi:hypothetical protein